MDLERLRALLAGFKDGETDLDETVERLRHLPFEDLGYARVDHHRSIRQGFPEVIFGTGKTPEQVAGIAARLLDGASNLLITRTDVATYERIRQLEDSAVYQEACRAITIFRDRK